MGYTMQVKALKRTDIGRTRYAAGDEFTIEEKYGRLLIGTGNVAEVGGDETPRRRGRPKGSRNKQMTAGVSYARSEIQTDDEESK